MYSSIISGLRQKPPVAMMVFFALYSTNSPAPLRASTPVTAPLSTTSDSAGMPKRNCTPFSRASAVTALNAS